MISRNKGIFSLEFLVPVLAFLFSSIVVEIFYRSVVRPQAEVSMVKRRLMASQPGGTAATGQTPENSIYIIIRDPESEAEIAFFLWGMIILGYKMVHITRERRLFKFDFVRVEPGERIIPEDAIDRYKELKTAIEREPRWRERLLPDCILAALHRFHATRSVQDASQAVRERAELASDELDSSLSLVRYIIWAIPAIGFIGTVRGIGLALSYAEEAIKGDISPVTSALGTAFNTTFVSLCLSLVLMFILHLVQSRQEAFVIETQTFCRDKLVDVMKVPTKEESAAAYS